MHFQHIELLWLLLAIPAMCVVFWLRERRKRRLLADFAEQRLLGRLQPDASRRRPIAKLILLCLAVAFLVFALANPLQGSVIAEGESSGVDMAVCIDVSNSMLAQDMRPDRLERSKQTVKSLMSMLGGDRISLVVFAGNAFIQMPLTNDYGATKMFLDQISTDMISVQGTAIGDAIEKGMATLGYNNGTNEDEPRWETNHSRAIVVISDGENHEDDAIGAAKKAASQGIMVCTIGIGSPEGSRIPVYDERGRQVDFRKDRDGKVITTFLNESMLRDVARAGNGIFVHASDNNAAHAIVKQLSKLDDEKFGTAQFSAFETKYQWPLGAGILCLVLEVLICERRNPRINFNKLIRRKGNK
ncbi:MAG: VWA domain-containing protein [Bacteroidales bacterium]|nr:VWA domain-containing protein [Bacteroidales bacterium]